MAWHWLMPAFVLRGGNASDGPVCLDPDRPQLTGTMGLTGRAVVASGFCGCVPQAATDGIAVAELFGIGSPLMPEAVGRDRVLMRRPQACGQTPNFDSEVGGVDDFHMHDRATRV